MQIGVLWRPQVDEGRDRADEMSSRVGSSGGHNIVSVILWIDGGGGGGEGEPVIEKVRNWERKRGRLVLVTGWWESPEHTKEAKVIHKPDCSCFARELAYCYGSKKKRAAKIEFPDGGKLVKV